MEKGLLRYFQNQKYNIKFLIVSVSLLFLIGSPTNISASTETNTGLISKFYKLAEDKDAGVRAELAETVGKTGKPEALKLLEKMSTDKNFGVREAVTAALGQTGRPEALKILKKIIKKENKQIKQSPRYSTNIKNTAVKAIMEINKEATQFLSYYPKWQKRNSENKKRRYYGYRNRLLDKNLYLQIIQSANNKTQAEKQAINLAHQTKKKVSQLLNTLTRDKESRVREEIIKNTPYIDIPEALQLLEKMVTGKEVVIRKKIVKALEKINTAKTMYLLETLAKDPDKDVRILAIQAMGKINQN